jgi:signal peptidase I
MTYIITESIDNMKVRKILNPNSTDRLITFLKYFVIVFCITIISYALFKWGNVEKVRVEGNSMLPTLVDKQEINIEKLSIKVGGFKRGQIVVINEKGKLIIKRIIGLSNEKVELKNKQVWIYNEQNQQGVKLNEDYLQFDANQNQYPTCKIPDCSIENENILVGKHELYLLGDNRIDSKDSRSYGPVDKKIVYGILSETDINKHTKYQLPIYYISN